jgi:hypothetical protein
VDQAPLRRIWLAVGLIFAGWIAYRGPVFAVDTPTYERWAEALIGEGFNVRSFLDHNSFTAPLQLYLLWILLIAVAKVAVGASWPLVTSAINAIALFLTARAVLASAPGRLATIAAAAALIAAADLWIFAPYVLSDMLFMAFSTIALAALIGDRPQPVAWPATALAAVTRPTAPPLIVTAVAVASRLTQWVTRHERTAVAIGLGAIAAALLAHAYAIAHPEAPIPLWLQPWFNKVRAGYAQGAAVLERTDTYVAPAVTVPAVVRLTLLKWIYFFSPWLPGYSVPHAIMNAGFFIPIYVACMVAVARASNRHAVVVLASYIALVSGFHAMQEVDFDHRYRLPIIPALIMLAAQALEPMRLRAWRPPRLGVAPDSPAHVP